MEPHGLLVARFSFCPSMFFKVRSVPPTNPYQPPLCPSVRTPPHALTLQHRRFFRNSPPSPPFSLLCSCIPPNRSLAPPKSALPFISMMCSQVSFFFSLASSDLCMLENDYPLFFAYWSSSFFFSYFLPRLFRFKKDLCPPRNNRLPRLPSFASLCEPLKSPCGYVSTEPSLENVLIRI